jgi:hypothetical protein
VDPGRRTEEAAAPPPLADAPDAEPILLLQSGGKTWSVPSAAALQRWILERRVDRDTMVSHHGMRWARAGEREDLAVFFAAADALSFSERNLRTELPPDLDEEIIVDAPEADAAAGPVVDNGRMVMDFAGPPDDTVEQTVRGGPLDEQPIPGVPFGFDRVEPIDRTEVVGGATARVALPVRMGGGAAGAATVAVQPSGLRIPTEVPLAFGASPAPIPPAPPEPVRPAPVLLPEPSVAAPIPASAAVSGIERSVPSHGPSVAASDRAPNFFQDELGADPEPAPGGPGVRLQPRADVFEDPPTGAANGTSQTWVWIALGAAVVLVVAFLALRGSGETEAVVGADAGSGGAATASAGGPLPAPGVPPPANAQTAVGEGTPVTSAPPVDPAAAEAARRDAERVAANRDQVEAARAEAERVAAEKAAAEKAAAEKAAVEKAAAEKAAAEKAAAEKARTRTQRSTRTTGASTESAGTSARGLVAQGWQAVEEGDFRKAHGLFDRALQSQTSSDALYGRGYANEKLGDSVSASDDYCQALARGGLGVDLSREVQAGLRRVGRGCP